MGEQLYEQVCDKNSYYYRILGNSLENNYDLEQLEQLLQIKVIPNTKLACWNFYPFYNRIRCFLLEKIEQIVENSQTICMDCQTCVDLSEQLASGFVWPSLRSLIEELYEEKKKNMLFGADTVEEYDFFLENYLNRPEYQRVFYQKYPAMTKVILDKLQGYEQALEKLFCRLAQDKKEIERLLCQGKSFKRITAIKVGLSDEHHIGETTVRITLDNACVVYYKPHSLHQEKVYQKIGQWLGQACGISWENRTILEQVDYGWEVEIKSQKCRNQEEVSRYYTRIGIQMAIAYVFSVSDLHFENLAVHGEYPVWIDMELFPGIEPSGQLETERNTMNRLLANSVLQSGILPGAGWGNGQLQLGALINETKQKTPFRMPVVRAGKTSEIHIEYDFIDMKGTDTAPYEADWKIEPWQFLSEILQGFEMAYRIMMEQSEQFLELVRREITWKSRYLFRNTQQYRMYQLASTFPELMRDSTARRMFLFRMERDIPECRVDEKKKTMVDRQINGRPLNDRQNDGRKEKLLNYEISNIMQDIFPIYWIEDKRLCMGNGEHIEDYFDITLEEHFQRKYDSMSKRDLLRQQKLIMLSMLAEVPAAKQLSGESVLIDMIPDKVVELLTEQTEWTAEGPDWLTVRYEGKQSSTAQGNSRMHRADRWYISGMDIYLYDGLGGVAVFLMAWKKVYQNHSGNSLLNGVVERIHRYTEKVTKDAKYLQSRNTGIFHGEASVVYTYLLLYRISREQKYISDALLHAKLLVRLLEEDRHYDILDGNAGAVVAFLQLYELTREPQMLLWAEHAGNLLISHARVCKVGVGWNITENLEPLAGMAHGNSGIALALARLWKITKCSEYDKAVRAALAYEDTLFDEKSGNWKDLRKEKQERKEELAAWCHGAAGILLARTEINEIYEEEITPEWMLAKARNCVKNSIGGMENKEYCLCHGKLGQILCNKMSVSCEQMKTISLIPKEENSFGLMTGITGIGYGWMRLLDDNLPDVLALH